MMNCNAIFQHDNANHYRSRLLAGCLHNNHIQVLLGPYGVPEFTAIEQLWDELDQRLRQRHRRQLPL